MNPHVSTSWLTIAFPAVMAVAISIQLWRQRPGPTDRLYVAGFLIFVLALSGAVIMTLFYQNALLARAWPVSAESDQVIIAPTGKVFVKFEDRVQSYDCEGKFQAAFQPDNAGGVFKIALNQDHTLSIYSVRTDSVDTFSPSGTFLRRHERDSSEMPFNFLKLGPSVLKAEDCEFTIEPGSGLPAVKSRGKIWTLERGDWILEYLLNIFNIKAISLFGGSKIVISYIRKVLAEADI